MGHTSVASVPPKLVRLSLKGKQFHDDLKKKEIAELYFVKSFSQLRHCMNLKSKD